MKKVFAYGFVIFFMLVTACRTGKNYQRPAVLLPERFRADSSIQDTSSIADISWRDYFSDPILRHLIDTGLVLNFDLQYALRNISIAQSQVKQSNWLWVPQINGRVSSYVYRNSDNGPAGVNNGALSNNSYDYLASLSMSWEIDIWGKISRQQESARANYLQTYEAAKAVQTSLVANIAQGYFNLLMLDQQLLQTKKTLDLNNDFVKLTRLLYDAGEVTYLGVQQAESQRDNTAQLIPQIEQSILIEENSLQLLTGSLPGTVHRISSLTDIHFGDRLETGLPVGLLNRRPDVRASELSLVQANAQVREAYFGHA